MSHNMNNNYNTKLKDAPDKLQVVANLFMVTLFHA